MKISEAQREAMRHVGSLLPDVRITHIDALFDEGDIWYSYKLISLYSALANVSLPGDYAQLGVYKGRCARFLGTLTAANRRLYLLDSFNGLPEDWIGPWKKGSFALQNSEIPNFEQSNIEIIPGWFSETVPVLASRLRKPLALIHADADLYSSTMDALNGLNAAIVPGTIILFDEYFIQVNGEFRDDEHRALLDWCALHGRTFEYLWKTRWVQVAVRITK